MYILDGKSCTFLVLSYVILGVEQLSKSTPVHELWQKKEGDKCFLPS